MRWHIGYQLVGLLNGEGKRRAKDEWMLRSKNEMNGNEGHNDMA